MQRVSTHEVSRGFLITAGPTHEPIDAVRYIGNRSSGRLGVALADEAARRGTPVTLLLGPTHLLPSRPGVDVVRFRTTADLERLLMERLPRCGTLIQAAAVADYRPAVDIASGEGGKLRREQRSLSLTLEPTPDLLAMCAARRRPGQVLIGFALEPLDRLRESALSKLQRKDVDAIIANPLGTMEAATIEAEIFLRGGGTWKTEGAMSKEAFAAWLLDRLPTIAPR